MTPVRKKGTSTRDAYEAELKEELNKAMEIKKVETEEEYEQALVRIDEIFDAVPGSEEAKELDFLVRLVSEYEEKHYPID